MPPSAACTDDQLDPDREDPAAAMAEDPVDPVIAPWMDANAAEADALFMEKEATPARAADSEKPVMEESRAAANMDVRERLTDDPSEATTAAELVPHRI